MPGPPRGHRYHVYVVELSRDVLHEARFRKANPDYVVGRPCVYVGMTGLDPDVRFDKHMAGIQSNRYVRHYGLRLLPELYQVYNPMPYEGAREMEVELAIGLRLHPVAADIKVIQNMLRERLLWIESASGGH